MTTRSPGSASIGSRMRRARRRTRSARRAASRRRPRTGRAARRPVRRRHRADCARAPHLRSAGPSPLGVRAGATARGRAAPVGGDPRGRARSRGGPGPRGPAQLRAAPRRRTSRPASPGRRPVPATLTSSLGDTRSANMCAGGPLHPAVNVPGADIHPRARATPRDSARQRPPGLFGLCASARLLRGASVRTFAPGSAPPSANVRREGVRPRAVPRRERPHSGRSRPHGREPARQCPPTAFREAQLPRPCGFRTVPHVAALRQAVRSEKPVEFAPRVRSTLPRTSAVRTFAPRVGRPSP